MSYPETVSPTDAALELLREISPPLSDTLQQHPHLISGPRDDDSVSLRMQASILAILLREIDGALDMAAATQMLSDSFDRIVQAELALSLAEQRNRVADVDGFKFAVIAMGKWGAGEINYYSDLDLVFVHEATDPDAGRGAAQAVASRLIARLSSPTFDGKAFNIDADLRPEGSMGPLSRSIDSYARYYERWGEPWELQALLKARPAAGDLELGRRFRRLADEIVWDQGLDQQALRSIRQLKARAEAQSLSSDLKRGRGGIRDIEFAVQLLQLVHGRFDPDLRVLSTLQAIDRLAEHEYLDAEEAGELAEAYVFMRRVEHLLQLRQLRQTHEIPGTAAEREHLARALGLTTPIEFDAKIGEVRRVARDLHERLYFRPILESLAGLEGSIEPADAHLRLTALGFADVKGASKAVVELTSGLNRRSRVMHQILPVMLDWLSQTPDPDLGLEQLRLVLARTRDHSQLVSLLQNNPLAGERLCILLGTGGLLGEWIDRIPEFIPRLASDARIDDIRDREGAIARLHSLIESRPDLDDRIGTIRRFTRRRKLRIAARDVLSGADAQLTMGALSDTADAAVVTALSALDAQADTFGVIAMGKWGGRELSYGSDIDLMYVHGSLSTERATSLARGLHKILAEHSRHGDAYELDADLRPEGTKGPLTRTLSSFESYYEKWVEPWEILALVKARPVAGHPDVLAAFATLLERTVWSNPPDSQMVMHIRSIKARIESERIPAGDDPDFHLKLGPGGLSDVEFAVQLLQLLHGHREPDLRTPNTIQALDALGRLELLTPADHRALRDAYLFCTKVRLRLHLQSGQVADSLPTETALGVGLAASLGLGRVGELRETYRKMTRRARRSFEKVFYET